MVLSYTRSKCILENLNVLFMAYNANILMLGIILMAGQDLLQILSEEMQRKFVKDAENMGVTISSVTLSLDHITKPIAVTTIIGAVVALVVCLVGYISYSYNKMPGIAAHFVMETLFFVSLIYLVIMAQDDVDETQKLVLGDIKESFQNYGGLEATDKESVTWNAVMSYHKCCGAIGYTDFDDLKKWPPSTIGDRAVALETPVICCKNKSLNFDCASKDTAKEENNWWEIGCYERIYEKLLDSPIFNFALIVYFLLLILILIFVIVTFCIKLNQAPPPPPPSPPPILRRPSQTPRKLPKKESPPDSGSATSVMSRPNEESPEPEPQSSETEASFFVTSFY